MVLHALVCGRVGRRREAISSPSSWGASKRGVDTDKPLQ